MASTLPDQTWISYIDLSVVDLESKTLQGVKDELALDETKQYVLENTTVDFQKLLDKEVLRITGPLEADFIVKVRPNKHARVELVYAEKTDTLDSLIMLNKFNSAPKWVP